MKQRHHDRQILLGDIDAFMKELHDPVVIRKWIDFYQARLTPSSPTLDGPMPPQALYYFGCITTGEANRAYLAALKSRLRMIVPESDIGSSDELDWSWPDTDDYDADADLGTDSDAEDDESTKESGEVVQQQEEEVYMFKYSRNLGDFFQSSDSQEAVSLQDSAPKSSLKHIHNDAPKIDLPEVETDDITETKRDEHKLDIQHNNAPELHPHIRQPVADALNSSNESGSEILPIKCHLNQMLQISHETNTQTCHSSKRKREEFDEDLDQAPGRVGFLDQDSRRGEVDCYGSGIDRECMFDMEDVAETTR